MQELKHEIAFEVINSSLDIVKEEIILVGRTS